MGIGKAGSISAPALFVFNLPVALARAPGKKRHKAEAVAHTRVVSARHKWQVRRPKEVSQVSSCCRNPI
jgi:hypothetical protein